MVVIQPDTAAICQLVSADWRQMYSTVRSSPGFRRWFYKLADIYTARRSSRNLPKSCVDCSGSSYVTTGLARSFAR